MPSRLQAKELGARTRPHLRSPGWRAARVASAERLTVKLNEETTVYEQTGQTGTDLLQIGVRQNQFHRHEGVLTYGWIYGAS